MLVGKRIKLSPVEREHLALLKNWRNDPDIRRRFFYSLPCTDLGQDIWYDQTIRSGKDVFFIIASIEKNKAPSHLPLIGYCSISNIEWKKKRGVATIFIGDKKYWGKKLGVEILSLLFEYAFAEMGLHKVSIYVFSDNKRSIGLFKRFASIEGELLAHEFQDGKWKNVTVMGLTEEMYFTQVRGKYFSTGRLGEELDQ
jgi:RimJ/RimL family protein N-acetyltransferase